MYYNLQELFLKACEGKEYEEQLVVVIATYKNDLSRQELDSQLPLLTPVCKEALKSTGKSTSLLSWPCWDMDLAEFLATENYSPGKFLTLKIVNFCICGVAIFVP